MTAENAGVWFRRVRYGKIKEPPESCRPVVTLKALAGLSMLGWAT
ncbi:MAG: hypothetical protein QXY49_06260 [Thermofilaceae archaeon]